MWILNTKIVYSYLKKWIPIIESGFQFNKLDSYYQKRSLYWEGYSQSDVALGTVQ